MLKLNNLLRIEVYFLIVMETKFAGDCLWQGPPSYSVIAWRKRDIDDRAERKRG